MIQAPGYVLMEHRKVGINIYIAVDEESEPQKGELTQPKVPGLEPRSLIPGPRAQSAILPEWPRMGSWGRGSSGSQGPDDSNC